MSLKTNYKTPHTSTIDFMQLQTDIIIHSEGSDVLNPDGDILGQITEVTYKDEEDQLKYMIIGTDHFYGDGHRHFAIPVCEELIKITEEESIIVQATREDLKNARGLKYEKCPDPHLEFSINIYELFGYTPSNNKTSNKNN